MLPKGNLDIFTEHLINKMHFVLFLRIFRWVILLNIVETSLEKVMERSPFEGNFVEPPNLIYQRRRDKESIRYVFSQN